VSTLVRQVAAERFEVVLPGGVVTVALTRASRDALGLRTFGPTVVVAAAVELLLEHGETIATARHGADGADGADGPDLVARLARHPGLLEELRARIG
jgi:hypothetical protein